MKKVQNAKLRDTYNDVQTRIVKNDPHANLDAHGVLIDAGDNENLKAIQQMQRQLHANLLPKIVNDNEGWDVVADEGAGWDNSIDENAGWEIDQEMAAMIHCKFVDDHAVTARYAKNNFLVGVTYAGEPYDTENKMLVLYFKGNDPVFVSYQDSGMAEEALKMLEPGAKTNRAYYDKLENTNYKENVRDGLLRYLSPGMRP